MSYDYERYNMIMQNLVEDMWRNPDDLEIGEDISDIPEVKIIFDGYGYNEETNEDDNTDMESYAIFIHKDALTKDFKFPEHDMTPWALIHRPDDEVCIYAWYDVKEDAWEFSDLEDRCNEHGVAMTTEQAMEILEGLNKQYYESEE